MIGKLLLTLLVIVLVVVYLRKRHQSRQRQARSADTSGGAQSAMPVRAQDSGELEQFLSRARSNSSSNKPASEHASGANPRTGNAAQTQALAPRIRAILWTLMGVLLIGGGIASYLHWQDQQRLVTVLLHRDASQPPVIYRVAKRNLGVNGFTTDDGTRVTVSANERMEVVGL